MLKVTHLPLSAARRLSRRKRKSDLSTRLATIWNFLKKDSKVTVFMVLRLKENVGRHRLTNYCHLSDGSMACPLTISTKINQKGYQRRRRQARATASTLSQKWDWFKNWGLPASTLNQIPMAPIPLFLPKIGRWRATKSITSQCWNSNDTFLPSPYPPIFLLSSFLLFFFID